MGTEYRDLREWLSKVEEIGELRRGKSLTVEEDAGRVAEILPALENGPAVILDELVGYEPGYRILLNLFGSTRRIALSFGFPIDSDRKSLLQHFEKKLEKIELIKPAYVETGPILENRLVGDDVNLDRFPVPLWHKHDGGPYIGTGCAVVTQDPDDGWVNLGTYRNQLFDKKTVGFYITSAGQGRVHREKYFSRGKPCPVAVVFGMDPLLFTGGMTDIPPGICEYDWVGGWQGRPVQVIKGPVTGLPVPANAEIVIEGFSYPGKNRLEGPFGESRGYYASGASEAPYIEAQALYFRNEPILLGMPSQKPPYDADKARQYMKSALLKQQLKQFGIPGITDVWCYGEGSCRLFVVVAIKQQYPGHSRQAGHAVYASRVITYGRYVIVVDDDIDVADIKDVLWAITTRSSPATSVDIIHKARSFQLDPLISPEDRAAGRYYDSRAIIDATKPFEWKDQFPLPVQTDQEYRRETRKKFDYLFK
ncbi:MAG: UbiD family decarboxylase [Chloroflexi bacterium]|nr:UbiD family decarboxylase [Chloroflexota bacterium]